MKLDLLTMGTITLFAAATMALAGDTSMTAVDMRYSLFNGLDRRSCYGQGVYPEPFQVDDSDLETREFRLDWLHTAKGGEHTDVVHPEVEWGFGNLTLELEVPYEHDVAGRSMTKGFDNVDVGARYPFYQYVSRNDGFDTTLGAAVELGIPTTSDVSHNTELVPKIFNDTKIRSFTMQSVFGYSMLYGPGQGGGVNAFEYGFVWGYDIPRGTLPLPGVDKIVPVAELIGEAQLNRGDAGHNSLTGDCGLRVNLKSVGRLQPRPGVVFVFPLNHNSRGDQHWGVMTSFVFEF